MKNRIFSFLIALILLAAIPVSVMSLELPDIHRKNCSIDVVLWDRKANKGIVGAELILYRVGSVSHDGDYNYHFYDIMTGKMIPDVEVTSTTAPAGFESYAKSGHYSEKYKVTKAKEGTYHFADLPTGLYLVMQTKAASGYSDMRPFLVSIPYKTDSGYQYDITANVKTEIYQEIKETSPKGNTVTGNKLPQTGQLTWPIPWMAASGMLLFALGWWLCFGSRKDSDES